jgi:hypothetical protein
MNGIANAKYVDAMDRTRTVHLVDSIGDGWRVKVFFDGNYCGNAELPDSLFSPEAGRYGFIPIG